MGIPNFECMNSRLSVFHTPQKFKPSPWKSNRAPQGKLIVFQASCFTATLAILKASSWYSIPLSRFRLLKFAEVVVLTGGRWKSQSMSPFWQFFPCEFLGGNGGKVVKLLGVWSSVLRYLVYLPSLPSWKATSESAKNGDQIRGGDFVELWHT